jgi:hypothetical protein
MKTSTMMTCMMTGKMCMCKSMDMCFVMKKKKSCVGCFGLILQDKE